MPWYAALIFPLLAVFPASRLDWIALAFGSASAAGAVPFYFFTGLHPAWLARSLRISEWGIVPLSITAVGLALLWLCYTNGWRSVASTGGLVDVVRRREFDRARLHRSQLAPRSRLGGSTGAESWPTYPADDRRPPDSAGTGVMRRAPGVMPVFQPLVAHNKSKATSAIATAKTGDPPTLILSITLARRDPDG